MKFIFKLFTLTVFVSLVSAQYYNVELGNTGEFQLITFQSSITSLEPGDEIGIFDTNGIQNSGDCSNQIGEVLVGAAVWDGSQMNISAIGSIDYCAFGGAQFGGWVEGNPLVVRIWKESTQTEYETELTFAAGTGTFGDLIIVVSEITLVEPPSEFYYNVDINSTGEFQLISFQSSITTLEPGDEIGIFDLNAVTNSGDCSNQIGELLVGAGVWDGSQLDISAIGSIDYCAFGDYQYAGWVAGNPVVVRIYKASEGVEYEANVEYLAGNGYFGDLILIVSDLTYGFVEIPGCTDPEAENYCPDCTVDDGSCEYADSAQVGNNGGTVIGEDGSVTIPQGALDEPTTITVQSVSPDVLPDAPEGMGLLGQTVAFTPHGLQFNVPVTITVPYDMDAESLILLRLDDEFDTTWEYVPGGVFQDGMASIDITSFSIYGVGSQVDCAGIPDGPNVIDDFEECCVDPSMVWYDNDGDGFGDPDISALACTEQPGWVSNGDDVDDNCFSNEFDCAGECDGSAYIDDCGICCDGSTGEECSYYNSEIDFGGAYDCAGECFGESYIDECGICDDDPDNDGLGCQLQWFTQLPPENGVSSLIIINITGGLNIYDEVGLYDKAGITNYNDCSNQIGEILVGAGIYIEEQMNVVAIGSVDNCSFGGTQLSGYVEGNPISYKAWDSSGECGEYEIPDDQVTNIVGNGVFGDIITMVNVDANRYGCMDPEGLNYDPCATAEREGDCQYFVTQTVTLGGLRWNNISFYLNPLDPAVNSIFPAEDVLIVTNDQSQFYLPGFGVNMIGNVDCTEGYMVYLNGVDDIQLNVDGYNTVPADCPIELYPLFWNNVAYQLDTPMSAVDAFSGLPILLVTDDGGNYFLPNFGVNTIDANGGLLPGKGYRVYLDGNEGATLVYPENTSLARIDGSGELRAKYEAGLSRQYLIEETGLAHPILITGIEGNVLPGDELVAYAGGMPVGAARIVDPAEPVLIVAWKGYHQYDIDLDGWDEGDQIELRLWSQTEQREMEVRMDLNNYRYDQAPLTTGRVIISDQSVVPDTYSLMPAFPNPFNPVTTISFRVPERASVLIQVYDMTGQHVAELVRDTREPGNYSVTWNAADQPSGIYFVKMIAGSYTQVQKVMLVK